MVSERKTKYKTGKEIVAEIKQGFKECGRSPKAEYTFEFHLYFKASKAAKKAELAVKKLGLKTEVTSAGKMSACIGYTSMVADYKKFEKWGQAFLQIAEQNGGEFDGWQMGPPESEDDYANLFSDDGEIDLAKLLGDQGGLVIGSQAMENPHKHEVMISIPRAIEPIDRGELYEDPLINALSKKKMLGVVLGGHSDLAPDPQGGARITGATIRLGTDKPTELLDFLQTWVKEKKFPKKTVVAKA